MAEPCIAPLSAKYIFTSHSSRSTARPVPPILNSASTESATVLASVFQWPGGVSESGPSAQNSAITRPKSARRTVFCGYGTPVTGFTA